MCTVYDVFKQVHKRPTDFKSRDSFPSLDLADWNRVRNSISRKSSTPFIWNEPEWLYDDIVNEPDGGEAHVSDDDDTDDAKLDNANGSDYSTEDPLERVRQENATSLPNFSTSPETLRIQSAFSWTPNKALDKQTFEIRRAIARQSIARGISFNLPASQTKLSINSQFQPEMYGLFTKKVRHEHDLWTQRRGGTSPRYLSQTPKLKPPPPPQRFIPDITRYHSPRDQFINGGKSKNDEQPTFLSSDLHNGNLTLPTAGMPTVRLRRRSLTKSKTPLELQEDVVNLWHGNSVQKAKHAFKKSLLKWKDGVKAGEDEDHMEKTKRADVQAWLDKMKLK